MKDNVITFINKSNEEVICDVLFTFNSEETGHDYIVYTDNTYDDDKNKIIYASISEYKNGELKLKDIKSNEEFKIVESILSSLIEKKGDKE